MKSLILLTSSFPYEGGEQFLETEIKYWKNTGFDNVYILPSSRRGDKRDFPAEIQVLQYHVNKSKIIYLLQALLNCCFYKEIFYIFRNTKVRFWLSNIKEALKLMVLVFREKDKLLSNLKYLNKGEITVYSYWNDGSFYASCILREKGYLDKVISRAHRFDIYEERRKNNYMPLKRQFSESFDKIYLLSEGAVDYYQKKYTASPEKLKISKLGVELPPEINVNFSKNPNKLRVLSLSYCVPVKQIHLIAYALSEYAKENEGVQVEWVHIGGGPLLESFKDLAKTMMALQSNFSASFLGQLSNSDVKEQLASKYFDLFINASESEGVPVSIMEAMSYQIPTIAPDVGGIADLVNETNGYLMPSVCTVSDIVKGINYIFKNESKINFRLNAYSWVAEHYNAGINYPEFIKELQMLAAANE